MGRTYAEVRAPMIELGRVTQEGGACVTVKFYDDSNRVIGTLQIGKSVIAWKPPKGRQGYRVPLDRVAEFLEKNGDKY